jgi:acetyltransferase
MVLIPTTERRQTTKGLTIEVRPFSHGDTPVLLEIFEGLGEESRYSRFQQPLEDIEPERLWAEAEQLLEATLAGGYGLLAFTDRPWLENQAVGAARYIMTGAGEAEVAVTVIDEMQGQGVGNELLMMLIDHARRAGIRRLVGVALNSNPRIWALIRGLPYPVTRQLEGTYTIVAIELDASAAGEPLAAADLQR